MLQIDGLRKKFTFRDTPVQALDDVTIDVAKGEFFVLLGPSGCGKTTMLRSIAGLERPDDGSIQIDDALVFAHDRRLYLPPERRPIGMVFQSYAVWPHMDVYNNIVFPLREGVRRLSKVAADERAWEVLNLLALSELADRPVTTLSGGQQQRVALARALALRPKVLLMDEPLSNLDFKLQLRLRFQLKDLMHRLGLTTVYVTHNQAEAMDLGDRIAVMGHGRLIQVGTPQEIYQQPADEFVARFFGDMTLIPARVRSADNHMAELDSEIGRFGATLPNARSLLAGEDCYLGIRPEDVQIISESGACNSHKPNTVQGRIERRQFLGEGMLYSVRVFERELRLKVHHSVDLGVGSPVVLEIPTRYCSAVPVAKEAGDAYAAEDTLETPSFPTTIKAE